MTTRTAALRLQLLDQVSGPAKATTSDLNGLEKNIGSLGRRGFPGAQNLGRQLDYLRQKAAAAGQFTEFRRGTAAAFGELRAARSRVEELRRSLATVTAPTGKMRADLRSAESALKQASIAFRGQRAATAAAGAALRTFGLNSRTAAGAQGELRGQMVQTIRRMREMAREARKTGAGQREALRPASGRWGMGGIGGAGIGGAVAVRQLTAPVGRAMTYDEILTYVASTMAGGGSMEEKQAAKIKVSDAIDAALQAGGGKRDDAAAALNRLIASGAFEGDEALETLGPVVKTAHASGASADDVAAMATAMRNNGIEPKDMQRAFDSAFRAGQLGGVELRDMARWLPQQLALARGSGMSGMSAVEWLASANQVALQTAGSPDEAANNLVNLLQKLNSRELATTMAKEVKPQKGDPKDGGDFDWAAFMVKRQKEGVSPPEAFAEILDRQLKGNKDYQRLQKEAASAKTPEDRRARLEQAAAIAEASEVGQLIADRQALLAALALRSGQDRQREITAELANSAGTTDRESEFIRSQPWSQVQDLKNTADRANEQTFNALAGPLGALTESVNETARAFPELTSGIYGAGTALAALAAGGTAGAVAGGIIGGRGIRGIFGDKAGVAGPQGPVPGAGGGAIKGIVGRGLGLGIASYLGELLIDTVLDGLADTLYTPEQRVRARKQLEEGGLWSRGFWRGKPVEPTRPQTFNGFDDLSRRGRGDVDESGRRYEGGRHRIWATGGPMPGEPVGIDPTIAAQAAAVSAAASGSSANQGGETNISAPVSTTVNQTFNGVMLPEALAAAREEAAKVAKQTAEGVVNTFTRALDGALRRSSETQFGGLGLHGNT